MIAPRRILLVLAALVLLTPTLGWAEDGWRVFHAKEFPFTIDSPREPEVSATSTEGGLPMTAYALINNSSTALIVVAGRFGQTDGAFLDDEFVIKSLTDRLEKKPGTVVQSNIPITLSGLPGRKLQLVRKGMAMWDWMVVKDGVLYQIICAGPEGSELPPETDRVVASFNILDD